MARWELEIESFKVVEFDFDGMKEQFPVEWAETLEDCGDEEEAVREFAVESYNAGGCDEFFFGTPHDSVVYQVTPPVEA